MLQASYEHRGECKEQSQADEERADCAVAEHPGYRVDDSSHDGGRGEREHPGADDVPATPQRTAESCLAAPEPMIEPEITWVVDRGYPALEAARMTVAPTACAAKPCATSILMIRVPSVLMIRQPPTNVPSAIALAEAITTQSGT